MAGEYLPPRSIPPIDKDGKWNPVWYEFFSGLYKKTGSASNNATELVVASAATASTVPPTVTSSGTPTGTVEAPAGSYYQDSETGDIYYNPSGGTDDWRIL